MSQLYLLPIDPDTVPRERPGAPVTPLRRRSAPRVAVGAPGYMSVRAAAEQLDLRPRSVRYLIERGRLPSQRLGRMHFLPTAEVEGYRRVRRARGRRRLV